MLAITNGKLVFPEGIFRSNLIINDDRIEDVTDTVPEGAEIIDAGGLYVGPGLIDEHLHGFHKDGVGHDIIDNCEAVASAHLKYGTTSCLPSPSYSLRMERYLDIIGQCNRAIERGDTSIVGIHLEGPYINYKMGAGRKFAWKYEDEYFEKLFTESKGNALMCTYAPEMEYAEKVETMINRYGAAMAIGHTQADPESIYRSASRGLKIVTHLFDATGNYLGIKAFDMTGDPQDGVSYVALGIPKLYYELICDKDCVHVTAPSQRLALKCAGEDHIILVSDCTYHKRAQDNGRDININDKGNLFGSKLTVAECAANFKRTTGADMRITFKCASTNSAKALGIYDRYGSIEKGRYANIVLADEDFNIKRVIFKGRTIG